MKKVFFAVMAVAMGLAGCATNPLPSPTPTPAPTIDWTAIANLVLKDAVSTCQALPSLEAVDALIQNAVGTDTTVQDYTVLATKIAAAICGPLSPAKVGAHRLLAGDRLTVTVNGVVVPLTIVPKGTVVSLRGHKVIIH